MGNGEGNEESLDGHRRGDTGYRKEGGRCSQDIGNTSLDRPVWWAVNSSGKMMPGLDYARVIGNLPRACSFPVKLRAETPEDLKSRTKRSQIWADLLARWHEQFAHSAATVRRSDGAFRKIDATT
jgi:hypothetical protein